MNLPITPHRPSTRRFVFALASLALGCLALAQTAPAPSAQASAAAPTAATPTPEEVVAMTPFQVNATQDRGYLATSTMSGTRLNSKLEDLAASISVVTKQQL